MRKFDRPSLLERTPKSRVTNLVDDQIASIDRKLLDTSLNVQTKETNRSEENGEPNPDVLKRISQSLKTRRVTLETSQNVSSDPIHIACLKGQFLRVSDLISHDSGLLRQRFNLSSHPFLKPSEENDPTYLPPPQTPKTIRTAVINAIFSPSSLTRDQKWLIDNSFQRCSLLHFACINDQREIIQFLLDQGIDPSMKNEANRTAEFYSASDEIKEMVISGRKKTQKPPRASLLNQNGPMITNALVKESGAKLLVPRAPPPPPPQSTSTAGSPPPPPPAFPLTQPPAALVPTPPVFGERYAKYEKMRKMLPEGAVRQKMMLEGFLPHEIDDFFAAQYISPLPTTSSQPNLSGISDHAKKGAPPVPPPRPEGLSLSAENSVRENASNDDGEGNNSRRNSRRLSTKRLSRVLSTKRMSDAGIGFEQSRSSDASVSDLTMETGPRKATSQKTLSERPLSVKLATTKNVPVTSSADSSNRSSTRKTKAVLPPRPPPPPPAPAAPTHSSGKIRSNIVQRSDSPIDSPPASPPQSPFDSPPNSPKAEKAGTSPPPPRFVPQPTTLNRPVLAMKRLSVVAGSNQLATTLLETTEAGEVQVKEEKREEINEYHDSATLTDKESLPVINKDLPTIKPFKRQSILENMQEYLPKNSFISFDQLGPVPSKGSFATTISSEDSHRASEEGKESTRRSSAFNYQELTKEEKVIFHYLNLEKMMLKLVPLEDIANRVLIENAENDEVLMKKIVENPSHYLQQMSSTLAQIKMLEGGSRLKKSSVTATADMSPAKSRVATSDRLMPGTTTTATMHRLGKKSPEKMLLANHMIPTTIAAATAASSSSPNGRLDQRLTFREMLWKRAADYMNRSLYDSTGPEFHRLRQEAYELGLKILQQEFKSMAYKEHWESIDLVQKKTVQTILSLKQNFDDSPNKRSKVSGFLYETDHVPATAGRGVTFDELFEGYKPVSAIRSAEKKIKRMSRWQAERREQDWEGEQQKFDADYYEYNLEEELEKLRERFDHQDLAVFDKGRTAPSQPPPPPSTSALPSRPRPPPPPPPADGIIPSQSFPLQSLLETDRRSGSNSLDGVDLESELKQRGLYPHDRSIVNEEEIVRYFQAITDR